MRTGPRSISRSASMLVVIVFVAGYPVAASCASARVPSSEHPIGAGVPAGGFAKEIQHPDLGHIRLVWTFEPDGRYAEIPIALDGQTSMHRRSVALTRSTAGP